MWYKKVARLLGGCFVCIVAVAVLLEIVDLRLPMHDRRERRIRTRGNLRLVSVHVRLAVKWSGEEPPSEMRSLMEFLQKHDSLLAEWPDLYTRWLDWENKKLIDGWGNPVRLAVISPHHYRFISAGANGKDQDGRGDDIVHDFDPCEFYEGADAAKNPNQ